MNKTVIFIVFAALVALTLIETVVILVFAPDHFVSFSGFVVVALGLASTFAATVWQLGKQQQQIKDVKVSTDAKLDVVQRQTNGTLSGLLDKVEEKNDEIARLKRRNLELENAVLHRPKKGKLS